MKRKYKKLISTALSLSILTTIVQLPAKAEPTDVHIPEIQIGEDILSNDVFYLASANAQLNEGENERYLLRLARGGDCTSKSGVTVKISDLTAKYGKDYTISLYGSDVSADNPKDNQSFLEQINGQEYTETPVYSDEEYAEMLKNDEELQAKTTEALQDTIDYWEESSGLMETEAEISEEDAGSVKTNPIHEAREKYTGIQGEEQRVTSTTDTMQEIQQMANVLTDAVVGANITVDFEEGESEKYIVIDVNDNHQSDGDRYFYLMLAAPYGTTTNSAASSCAVTIADDEEKVLSEVGFAQTEYRAAGHTYYLQFSGFLMKYAMGRINVRKGQTIEFTKKTDSNFIYVNNPEYISNEDIVDDTNSRGYKIFEQKNVRGSSTYYQPNLEWYNSDADERYYPKQNSFYIGIDFYNPNSYEVSIEVNNLVATENKTYLQHYINKTGENVGAITVAPKQHAQLFDYTANKMICHRIGDLPSSYILFDFIVKKANGVSIPYNEGITISSLAAYNYENMRLKSNESNILVYQNKPLNHGDMLYGSDTRPTEHDLRIKYKGIAENQSNQIDTNLEFTVDNGTHDGIEFELKDKNGIINGTYPAKQTDWNVQINPINDEYEALLHTTTKNLHSFTYDFNGTKKWYFDYKHRNTDYLTTSDNSTEINQSVPNSIIAKAAEEIISGHKSTVGAIDESAIEMGSWGVVYHYVITVNNVGTITKTVKYRIKTDAHLTLIGMRENENDKYTFKDSGMDTAYQIPFTIEIPPGQKTFEIVTMSGAGNGGLENTLIVE